MHAYIHSCDRLIFPRDIRSVLVFLYKPFHFARISLPTDLRNSVYIFSAYTDFRIIFTYVRLLETIHGLAPEKSSYRLGTLENIGFTPNFVKPLRASAVYSEGVGRSLIVIVLSPVLSSTLIDCFTQTSERRLYKQ